MIYAGIVEYAALPAGFFTRTDLKISSGFAERLWRRSITVGEWGGGNDVHGIRKASPSGRSFDLDMQSEEIGILEGISQRDRSSFPERSAGITPRSLFHH